MTKEAIDKLFMDVKEVLDLWLNADEDDYNKTITALWQHIAQAAIVHQGRANEIG